ncbi:MAG: DUF2238 domain-containing protein [Acidobacteriota bacterium]
MILLTLWTVALVASGYHSFDPFTWLLEVIPAMVGVAIMLATYRRFRLSNLLYVLIFVHSLILMLGGHYTYAQVPLGFWMESWFGFARNNYDRIGHFAQGFVPAMIARELLLHRGVVNRKNGAWLATLIILSCLGISAIYELIEWRTAVASGSAADAFLGTQGDPWDTQEDMAMAGVGAITALLVLSRAHDRILSHLGAASFKTGAASFKK